MPNQNQSPAYYRRCKVCRFVNPITVPNCRNCHADLKLFGEVVFDSGSKPSSPMKGILIGAAAVLAVVLLALAMFHLGAMVGGADPTEPPVSMQDQPKDTMPSTEGQKETVFTEPPATEKATEPPATEPPATEKAKEPSATELPATEKATEPSQTQVSDDYWMANVLRADPVYYSNEEGSDSKEEAANWPVFGSTLKRREVRSVTFLSTLEEASDTAWDVSAYENGSVLAWVEPNGSLYDLYIAAEGGINAGECQGLFSGYTNVTSIDFCDHFSTEYADDLSYMFYVCQSLPALDLSTFDTSSVTDMSGMFMECTALEEVVLSSFDTSKVTNMGGMFRECTALKELVLSNFITSKVEDMNHMFYLCSSLTELDLSSFDTSRVTTMRGMFRECKAVKEIKLDVDKFDTSNVRDMFAMFCYCNSLRELDISGFDTSQVTDMSWMFYVCPPINAEDVLHFNTESVTHYKNFMRGSEWKKMFE